MHQHVLSPIGTARRQVAKERAEVEAERDAFATFGERVAGIKPRESLPCTEAAIGSIRAIGNDSPPTAAILASYRETVMAVDHYPEIYDESLEHNMRAELGPDVASGLRNGAPLTPTFKRIIQAAVTGAREQREQVIEILNAEYDSLKRSCEGFATIIASLPSHRNNTGARSIDESLPLHDLEERFQTVLDARCEVIQARSLPGRLDGHDLCAYLYRSTAWTYPVLTVGATVANDLRALRERQEGLKADSNP